MIRLYEEMQDYATRHRVPIIRPEERPLFCELIKKAKGKRILEIGTAIGYSTLLLAQYSDPSCHIWTIEVEEKRIEKAREYIQRSPYAHAITLIHGDAREELDRLEGPFDLVFMDGPKGQYVRYLEQIKPKLIEGAIIMADNILFRNLVEEEAPVPHRYRTIVYRLREYLKQVQEEETMETILYRQGDGLAWTQWKGEKK